MSELFILPIWGFLWIFQQVSHVRQCLLQWLHQGFLLLFSYSFPLKIRVLSPTAGCGTAQVRCLSLLLPLITDITWEKWSPPWVVAVQSVPPSVELSLLEEYRDLLAPVMSHGCFGYSFSILASSTYTIVEGPKGEFGLFLIKRVSLLAWPHLRKGFSSRNCWFNQNGLQWLLTILLTNLALIPCESTREK